MIENLAASINSEGDERWELANDDLILYASTQSNVIAGQDLMVDVCFLSPWWSSSMSMAMTTSTRVLEFGKVTRPSQNLPMMNVNSAQLTLKDTKLEEPYICQPLANEQLYENDSAQTSELTIPPATQHTRGCIRGVPSTNLNSLCKLDQCGTIDYSSSYIYHNVKCTPDSCLSMTPDWPPQLHLQKESAPVPFPNNLYCVISPYPDPSVISEINKLSSCTNTSSNKVSVSVQKTQKNFAHDVLMSSVEGSKLGIAADEFESAKSKYDNNGSPNLCISWSGP